MGEVEYPGGVPPTWQVAVRRVPGEDGGWLVYYDFVPSHDVREVVLAGEAKRQALTTKAQRTTDH